MSNFSQSLDKYLTTEPDNGFDTFVEQTLELIPSDVWEANQDWFDEDAGECNKLLNEYSLLGLTPQQTAPLLVAKTPNK